MSPTSHSAPESNADTAAKLADAVARLTVPDGHKFVLAEMNDLLSALPVAAFSDAVADVDVRALSPFLQNYVTAMVEHAGDQKLVPPPVWAAGVEPLELPYFAVPTPKLRMHLLRAAPVAFKRRNIFIDATIGDRV